MTPELDRYFRRHGKVIDTALLRFLPRVTDKPAIIHDAMRYSVMAGGKRLRPILVIAAAEICGGKASDVIETACALEFVHTYSLIHDDLPAMDNDDLRRGKPTNHKVYGEDIAILAGDALLTRAFELLAQNSQKKNIEPRRALEAVKIVAQAAGSRGMVGGQVADIKADKGRWKNLKDSEFRSPEALLDYIHRKKTAALIQGSLMAGALVAGGNRKQVSAMERYGHCLGLIFQITDDILDVVGDKVKLGKRGSDRANKKLTYPEIFGLDSSKLHALKFAKKAHAALASFGTSAQVLHLLTDFVVTRDH